MICQIEGCEEPAEPLMLCRGCAGHFCMRHMNVPMTMAHAPEDHLGDMPKSRVDRAVAKARELLLKIPTGPLGTERHGRGEILTIGALGHPLNIVGLVDPASQWPGVRELLVWSAEFAEVLALTAGETVRDPILEAKQTTKDAKEAFHADPSEANLAEWEQSLVGLREGSAWGQQEARNHEEEIKTERAAMKVDEQISSDPTMRDAMLTADYLRRQALILGLRRGLRCSQRVAAWLGAQQNAIYVPLEKFDRYGERR